MPIQYSFFDRLLIAVDNGVRSLFAQPISRRPNPAMIEQEPMLTPTERKQSAALMRVNHAGEVCAQALYYGQAITAKSIQTKNALLQAAEEETDHLAWCQERIEQLGNHTSYLNPLWYVGSFTIGLLAGIVNDKFSLGFVVETERQVEKHLQNHLTQIAPHDNKSRLILEQMCEDETHHATVAMSAGAIELPIFVKKIMAAISKVMTTTTYYV
ncbi:MAG: 2-polyprenyl-3-methyl-6-methoxy-1,4-benzoquinone monooxygenase [Gammaproteobacteria bacterium]|nr:2-polyprenyl-3-methyl-6-methoxy-1,4-benzoquinone monooxygenase [Gammaproteobacteria bacterium]